MSANWEIVDSSDADYTVSISTEARRRYSEDGLRRADNDNALLKAITRAHEIVAGAACGLIVVAFVWAIFRSL